MEKPEKASANLGHRLEREAVHPHCAISVDEMTIKSGLVFNKHSGRLTGFVDLGDVNRDMEQLLGLEQDDSSSRLADQALVFMARAVFKPSLAVPAAHYFSLNLSGKSLSLSKRVSVVTCICMIPIVAEKMFPLAWSVVEVLELYDIPAVSLTSDGAKPNRQFFHLCQEERTAVPYKTDNPYRKKEDLFFFCDPPHLLKTARNCFSNSFAHSKSRNMKVNILSLYTLCMYNCTFVYMYHGDVNMHDLSLQKQGEEISWKWIESLYLGETSTETPGVRLGFKLTRDHVWLNSFTRMRVYLATQVRFLCIMETM